MNPTIGSLFTGTGALDLAVMDVFGGQVVWHSQYEPPDKNGREDKNQYAAKILARHWPETPNLGDITKVDWAAVAAKYGRVDILTGGFPCTDVSSAGQRAGLTRGTRSGLWNHMAYAISVLNPRLVVIENVEGLLSAPADRGLGLDAEALEEEARAGRILRALGAVLGDLASLGFHAEWARVAASEVGAPHARKRVFVYAWPADADPADLGHERTGDARRRGHGSADGGVAAAHTCRAGLEVGRVEPDGPQLPAAERGRREPAADTDRVESERWGGAGVLGGQAAAEPGEGDQRERAGDAAGDRREAAADADGREREGHQERHRGPEAGQPERERWLDAVGRGVRRPVVEPVCPTCGCGESFHDAGGFCAGCHGCADPELGRTVCYDDGYPVCDTEVAADTASIGRGEGRPEPARQQGGPDAAQCGSEAPSDAEGLRHGDSRTEGERGLPAAAVTGGDTAGYGAAPSDTDLIGRRADVLDLRPGQPDLDWGDYGPAIRRWGHVLGRPAPWPTDALGRLSPVFTEWLMGLPDGWVTCTPGLPRPAMLRALGNGVVPQQAVAALRLLHARACEEPEQAAA